MPEKREPLATAWLETIGPAQADTIEHDPSATISPPLSRMETAKKHAFAVLERLSQGPTRFELANTIGQGGMGVVRLASQVAMGRTVAVKTLRPGRRTTASTLSLLREAWITGSLEHPNIVPVHDVGIDSDGNPLIILKRIEGVSWNELARDADAVRERFGTDDLLAWNLDIFLHVINAIRFAHSRGILHRDLKPENVMIGEFGEVYVLDWGIAVSLQDDDAGRLPLASEAKEMAGTPSYMAPEMLGEGSAPLSERTDVYLLGALLYELITGEVPHRGKSAVEIMRSVLISEPTFPDGAPEGLSHICRRAMAAEPADRYASADDVRVEVQRYLKHRGSARLVATADASLAELLALCERRPSIDEDETAWRQSLYRLFGGCRFGFQEALHTWPDNAAARDGLQRAVVAMAEHELATGRARAAQVLVNELDAPPAALRERIDIALAALAAQEQRMVELEKLSADWEVGPGSRTRTFLGASLSSFWLLVPLLIELTGYRSSLTHPRLFALYTGFSMAACLGFYWSRESMTKTAVNRRIMGCLIMSFAAVVLFEAGAWALALPVSYALVFFILIWATTAGMITIAVESRVWVMTIGFTIAFLIAVWRPSLVLYCMTGGNVIMSLHMAFMWRKFRHFYDESNRRFDKA